MMRTWLVAALALTACAGPRQIIKKVASAPKPPRWMSQLPKEPGYVYVVGVATNAKSLEDGKQAASQNAAMQVSNVVGTTVSSEFESHMSTDTGQSAREDLQARTAAIVRDLEVVDEYHEKVTKILGSYYNESYTVDELARYPLAAAKKERQRQVAEQKAQAADAYARWQHAEDHEKSGQLAEARVSVAEIRHILRNLPNLTPVGQGGFKTVADLLRDVDEAQRRLDGKAHGVRLVFSPADPLGKQLEPSLTSALTTALEKTQLVPTDGSGVRFVLNLHYSTTMAHHRTMGQRVGYLTYAANVRDTWRGTTDAGSSLEVKGFGKSPIAALTEAAGDAAERIAKAVAVQITAALAAEVAPAKDTKN